MRRAVASASSALRAMPFSGCASFSFSTTFDHSSRSSAASMASTLVPRIRMPAFSSPRASFNGVWPPNWTMAPIGFSRRAISSTSSNVRGSK